MKMYQKIFIATLLVLFLGGAKCSKEDIAASRIELDPSLLVRCPELPYVDLERVSLGDLTLEYSKLQGQYIECAIRNDCIIEAVGDKTVVTCPVLEKLNEVREETNG